MTPMETIAKKVAGNPPASRRDGTPARNAANAQSQIAFVGVRLFGLTRCQMRCPGTAPSREKAKSIREFAVRQAFPAKNCAMQAMPTNTFAPVVPIAS